MDRKYLSAREIQLAEYDILKEFVKLLDANGIEYILCGGSMLGAVRHGGFIPWDDDIDVAILRKDYERLKEIARKDRYVGKYRIGLPGDDKHIYPFIKVIDESLRIEESLRDSDNNGLDQCLWIDVFPLDHYPDEDRLHKKYLGRIRFLMRAVNVGTLSREFLKKQGWYDSFKKRTLLRAGQLIYRIMGGYRKISVYTDKFSVKMNKKFEYSDHVGDGVWPNGMNDYFNVSMVTPVIKHKFEDGLFSIPEDYDGYLTSFYGDYMTLPPEEKRITHNMNVYRIDK